MSEKHLKKEIHRITGPADPVWTEFFSLYQAAFPEGERELRSALETYLSPDGEEGAGGHIALALLGASPMCQAGILFSYLRAVNCGYVSYLMVNPSLRRRGLGTELFWAAKHTLDATAEGLGQPGINGIFTELEKESDGDPLTFDRLRFWQRLNVLPLDFYWEYPRLNPLQGPVDMYLAYRSFRRRATLDPSELAESSREIYRATYSYLPGAARVLARVLAGIAMLPPQLPINYRTPTSLHGGPF